MTAFSPIFLVLSLALSLLLQAPIVSAYEIPDFFLDTDGAFDQDCSITVSAVTSKC